MNYSNVVAYGTRLESVLAELKKGVLPLIAQGFQPLGGASITQKIVMQRDPIVASVLGLPLGGGDQEITLFYVTQTLWKPDPPASTLPERQLLAAVNRVHKAVKTFNQVLSNQFSHLAGEVEKLQEQAESRAFDEENETWAARERRERGIE